MVLRHSAGTIRDARIRLDGKGDREFRRKLLVYLRKNLNTEERKIVKNIRFRDSRKDVLIQLADMVAGSINRSFQAEKTDAQTYLGIIKPRVEDIWVFK